ncbi:MAG: hypothetical protein ACQEQH_02680 [Bacillota bacterium]
MAKESKRDKKSFDLIIVLILLLVLFTLIDLNISLEQILGVLIG